MTILTKEQRKDAQHHAGQALQRARAGDWATTSTHVQTVIDNYGLQGIHTILLGLADTLIVRQGLHRPGATVVPAFLNTDEGRIENVDDTPPRIRWAGRFIAARASDDQALCQSLLDSCADPAELLQGLTGMFEVAVETLNRIPGGP